MKQLVPALTLLSGNSVPSWLTRTDQIVKVYDRPENLCVGSRRVFVTADGIEYVRAYGFWYVLRVGRLPGRAGVYSLIDRPVFAHYLEAVEV